MENSSTVSTRQYLGPIFISLAAFLWALDGVIIRPALYVLPVSLVVFLEHGLATVVMIPLLFFGWKEIRKLNSSDWLSFLWVAIFGGVIGTMAITKALFYVDFINLSVVVLIQKLQPIFALSLAALLLKERLPRRFFFWAVAAVAATYFVAFGTNLPNVQPAGTAAAALFSLLAAFAWGSGTVFSKRALTRVSYQVGTFLRFGLTTVIMVAVLGWTGGYSAVDQVTSPQWWRFILIVFTSGAAAMLIYYYGLKRVPASISTICELTFPLSAILLEYLVRGRTLSISQWVGVLIVFVAIYHVSTLPRPASEEAVNSN